jgi:hypothetical protein
MNKMIRSACLGLLLCLTGFPFYTSGSLKLLDSADVLDCQTIKLTDRLAPELTRDKKQKVFLGWLIDGIINGIASWFAPSNGYGKFDEKGHKEYGPYFLFKNDGNIQSQLTAVRTAIQSHKDNWHLLYEEIYNTAGTSIIPTSCDGAVCDGSIRAKASAFVFIVGIEIIKDTVGPDTTYFNEMTSSTERNGYRNRAFNYISMAKNHDLDIFKKNCDAADFWLPFGLGSTTIAWIGNLFTLDAMQYRSKDLLMMVQTLDMLKWCNRIDPSLSTDQNKVELSEDNIKFGWAVPMHKLAMDVFGYYQRHNNLTLMMAAALGAAAIELNSKGDEFLNTDHFPRRWANSANYNIHNTMWKWGVANGKMSDPGDLYGFAEGPHYFAYSFESLLPYFIAKRNYKPEDYTESYYSWLLDLGPHRVRNFYFDPDYDRLYRWYFNITQPDDAAPAYDDTYHQSYFNGVLSLASFEVNRYHYVRDKNHLGLIGQTNIDLKPDYLAMNNPPQAREHELWVKMPSGNIVINGKSNQGVSHYLHFLAEDKERTNGAHEHNDMGSFIIGLKDTNTLAALLAIDPPFFGEDAPKVNLQKHHNIITSDDDYPVSSPTDAFVLSGIDDNDKERISFTFTMGADKWVRKVEVSNMKNTESYYYTIEDKVKVQSGKEIRLNINANGDGATFTADGNSATWDYPCVSEPLQARWGLLSTVTCSDPSVSFSETGSGHYHGNKDKTLTLPTDPAGYGTGLYHNGSHSRLVAKVESDGNPVTFTTILTPKRCIGNNISRINPRSNERYAIVNYHYDQAAPNDSFSNLHVSRNGVNPSDTIINPFDLAGCSKVLETDAIFAFAHWKHDGATQKGLCDYLKGNINLRKASISHGSKFKYDDTLYIDASATVNELHYEWKELFKYSGYIDGDATVKFYLPDMIPGVPMLIFPSSQVTVTDIKHSDHPDSVYNFIEATFSGKGRFTIDVAQPCNFDCYFPPQVVGVDTLFRANDGDKHTLGHKLTIKPDDGILRVSNSTRIDFCPDTYIRNRDTLIIEGPCQWERPAYTTCDKTEDIDKWSQNSAIIISAGAGLVLDSGSYTYIRSGGSIWVKPYGSLIIKNNAFLQIGDSSEDCGFAEIITDPGSYLYIEPDAHIEFDRSIGDTADKHVFRISNSFPGTYAEIYPALAATLEADTILPAGSTGIPICALDSINPVKNKHWGHANFMRPFATYIANDDTLCPGQQLCIDFSRIRNESRTEVLVCKVDSIAFDSFADGGGYIGKFYRDTCIRDTFLRDSLIIRGDDTCRLLREFPDNICYQLRTNSLHRITVSVYNDCGIRHDTVGYVFMSDTPRFSIQVPDRICPGIGTLSVNVTDSVGVPVHYTFGLQELPDTLKGGRGTSELFSMTKQDSGYLPTSFTFDSVRFYGNRRYAVFLAVTNNCGSYVSQGIVSIPLQAKVKMQTTTTYSNPVGPSSFMLQASAINATNYNWDPADYLAHPDSLETLCTPPGPMQYVLTASDSFCTDYDTVTIVQNQLTYAGGERTICYGDTILLGTDFDGIMFLGLLDYWGSVLSESPFESDYENSRTTSDVTFQRDFTRYIIKKQMNYTPPHPLGTFVEMGEIRNRIRAANWYMRFVQDFIVNEGFNTDHATTFQIFREGLASDPVLEEDVAQYDMTYSGSDIENMFGEYVADGEYPEFLLSWEQKPIDSTDWESLTAWTDYATVVVKPHQTTRYRLTVIDNNLSLLEYDSITVFVDTTLSPSFLAAFQVDSTVYFLNTTLSGHKHNHRYHWDFGDGSSTVSEENPNHTFIAFDSIYRVCFSVSNLCDSFTFCDSVKVDSTSLLLNFFNKKEANDESWKPAPSAYTNGSNEGIVLTVNVPNPFSQYSAINYSIPEDVFTAEIKVTNTLGQTVKSFPIRKNKGSVVMDAGSLQDGIYFYSLLVNGTVVKSRNMVIQRQ